MSWEATRKAIDPTFFSAHRVSRLRQQSDYFLEYQGRLTHPMRYDRASDRYVPIECQDSFALISRHLHAL